MGEWEEGQPAKYRIVSGRKRYAAFVKLKKDTIPAHILTFQSEDPHKDALKKLAEYEDNIVRNQLSLVELCEHLGKCKKVYEELYPETKQGKASKKRKDPGTRSLPYVLNAERMFGKSRATIGKLIHIYRELIESNHVEKLQAVEHPILHRVEDLSALAKSKEHIPVLVEIMCKYSDQGTGKFYSLQDAQDKLKRKEEAKAQRKARKATERSQAPSVNNTRSQVTDKSAHDTGDSDSDTDDADNMDGETKRVMEGLPLESVLEGCIVILQQEMDQNPHTFSVEISQEHNAVHFVFSSTISKPEDVTDLPSECPGWGLHNQSIETCSTCACKTRCEEAQTVIAVK